MGVFDYTHGETVMGRVTSNGRFTINPFPRTNISFVCAGNFAYQVK